MSYFYLIFFGLLISGTYDDATSTKITSCRTDQFECDGTQKCIPVRFQCDGIKDCSDGTDEQLGCVWANCRDVEHRCTDGTCVQAHFVCDGKQDCSRGTDEEGCGAVACKVNEFKCRSGQKCIPMRWRCDSQEQCSDSSDELYCYPRECPDGLVACDSGECVRAEFFCDGLQKCDDGSDEKHCDYEDSDVIYLNKGPNIYAKIRTKEGLEFTHLLPTSVEIKATGVHNGMKITGLAFDYKKKYLFVSDAREPAISLFYMSSLISSYNEWIYLVKIGLVSPMGIAYDYTSDNLYWIDSGTGKAEVTNVNTYRRTAILKDLPNPIALAISPNNSVMFIVTTNGIDTYVTMYNMDGSNRRILDSVQGSPVSLAAHPTKLLLYWTDHGEGTISYMNYFYNSKPKILRKNIDQVMSVTVTERNVYFTSGEPENFTLQRVNRFTNPGSEKDEGWNCITSATKYSGHYECLKNAGGCDYICLTSGHEKTTCACSPGMRLDENGKSCSVIEE